MDDSQRDDRHVELAESPELNHGEGASLADRSMNQPGAEAQNAGSNEGEGEAAGDDLNIESRARAKRASGTNPDQPSLAQDDKVTHNPSTRTMEQQNRNMYNSPKQRSNTLGAPDDEFDGLKSGPHNNS